MHAVLIHKVDVKIQDFFLVRNFPTASRVLLLLLKNWSLTLSKKNMGKDSVLTLPKQVLCQKFDTEGLGVLNSELKRLTVTIPQHPNICLM